MAQLPFVTAQACAAALTGKVTIHTSAGTFRQAKMFKACPESLKPELFETLYEFVAKKFSFPGVANVQSKRSVEAPAGRC